MSLLTRPSVVFAIVFGCFAVLVPRVFWPILRGKPVSHQIDDNFRRPPPPVSRGENADRVEHIPGSPHMRGAHPGMRMHHPGAVGANERAQSSSEYGSSKSVVTFALPMYTVGIGVFFIYTCCKYWSKRNTQDNKSKHESTGNIRWDTDRRKFQYSLDKNSDEEHDDDHKEDLFAGLDPDYVEFLKLKKQKALEAEKAMSEEQRQMHRTLDEMKKSLSFISTKLMTKENRGNLNNSEIVELQARLASTESQMCHILTALDAASSKVNELTKNTSKSLRSQVEPTILEETRRASVSNSESENRSNEEEEENSNSDDDNDSGQPEDQAPINAKDEEESSSSSGEEEGFDQEKQNDDDSHSSSSSRQDDERYGGLMETDYGRDPTTVEDFEMGNSKDSTVEPKLTTDTQTKVHEWRERNHSQSLGSSNSSLEQDQRPPAPTTVEQNRVTKRRRR